MIAAHPDDNWRSNAACRGYDTNMFVPEGRGEGLLAYAITRPLCETCPVQQACLDYALLNSEEYGMWGGTTPEERKRIGYEPRGICRTCGCRFRRLNGQSKYCGDCRALRRRAG